MTARTKIALLSPAVFLLLATGWAARSQQPQAPSPPVHQHDQHMPNPGANAEPPAANQNMNHHEHAEAEATQAMQPGHQMHGAHMRMTPRRPATSQDLQRAEEIVVILRDVLEPYKDYRLALAEGYRIFMPNLRQREYHFNNYWNGFLEGFTFDAARPTSLLYRKTRDGYQLTGAMFTAPKNATLEQLDERVPLSVAQWHAHVNLCLPPQGGAARFDRRQFGLSGSIATLEACREAGGQFYPQIFGWMVHVYPFAAPEKIWAQ